VDRLPFLCAEGEALRTIVQYKWESDCKAIFILLFKAYLLFVFCFVLTTLLFDSWQSSDSLALRVAAWSLWGFSLAYTLLLTKREIHQVYRQSASTPPVHCDDPGTISLLAGRCRSKQSSQTTAAQQLPCTAILAGGTAWTSSVRC
jgi:hypothetical protein